MTPHTQSTGESEFEGHDVASYLSWHIPEEYRDNLEKFINWYVRTEAYRLAREVIGQGVEYKKLSICPVCKGGYMYSCTCADAQEALVIEQNTRLQSLVKEDTE